VADAARPCLADASADCIVSLHLFEHLSDPASALASWRAALKPGGRLVILTPNARFSHPEEFDDPDHKHLYDGRELSALVDRNGFVTDRVLTVGIWGVRRWPWFWRYQWLCERLRLPDWPGLRWRGQTLCLSAVKASE
jgi:SAM-dependent methyltransferase